MKDVRFKFRIWDKVNNKWCNEDVQFIDNDGSLLVSQYDTDIYCHCRNEDDFIIEQCTGVLDKNGKLIYEGDIVKDCNDFVGKVIFSYDEVGSCGCCYDQFVGCGFVVQDLEENRGILENYKSTPYSEIIGNIHENYDLLEKM